MSKNSNELPSVNSARGVCTRCGYTAQFTHEGDVQLNRLQSYAGTEYEQASFLKCQGCDEVVMTISMDSIEVRKGVQRGEPFFYYPPLGSRSLDASIPTEIASCYEESQRCLSVAAYRAAVVMCRNALALFVEDKGSITAKSKPNLYEKLQAMANEKTLHELIADWATLVRIEGNAGAHQEDYEPVEKEKAEHISEITRQILYLHYEVPSQVAKSIAQKTPKK